MSRGQLRSFSWPFPLSSEQLWRGESLSCFRDLCLPLLPFPSASSLRKSFPLNVLVIRSGSPGYSPFLKLAVPLKLYKYIKYSYNKSVSTYHGHGSGVSFTESRASGVMSSGPVLEILPATRGRGCQGAQSRWEQASQLP